VAEKAGFGGKARANLAEVAFTQTVFLCGVLAKGLHPGTDCGNTVYGNFFDKLP
jgi:hypothetical protein